MKVVINAFFGECILCYFRYFLQLMLELLLIMFIHNATRKRMLHMLNWILSYKCEQSEKLMLKMQPIIFKTIKLIEKILMQGCSLWQKNITRSFTFITMVMWLLKEFLTPTVLTV